MAGGYFALVLGASVLLIAILLYAVALPLMQDVSISIPSTRKLAKKASIGNIPIGPQINKGKENIIGYYWHYHPNPRTGAHIFYI